jgi:hypothetical protein
MTRREAIVDSAILVAIFAATAIVFAAAWQDRASAHPEPAWLPAGSPDIQCARYYLDCKRLDGGSR